MRVVSVHVTRCRALRLARRESQSELAARVGMSQTLISAIERGLPASDLVMERIGNALGCDPKRLLDRVFDPAAAVVEDR